MCRERRQAEESRRTQAATRTWTSRTTSKKRPNPRPPARDIIINNLNILRMRNHQSSKCCCCSLRAAPPACPTSTASPETGAPWGSCRHSEKRKLQHKAPFLNPFSHLSYVQVSILSEELSLVERGFSVH